MCGRGSGCPVAASSVGAGCPTRAPRRSARPGRSIKRLRARCNAVYGDSRAPSTAPISTCHTEGCAGSEAFGTSEGNGVMRGDGAVRSTQEAALGSEARWLRHLFSYADTWVLVALFVATQILDTITTAYAVGTGQFSEANPLFGHLVNAVPLVAYGSKLLIAFLVLS